MGSKQHEAGCEFPESMYSSSGAGIEGYTFAPLALTLQSQAQAQPSVSDATLPPGSWSPEDVGHAEPAVPFHPTISASMESIEWPQQPVLSPSLNILDTVIPQEGMAGRQYISPDFWLQPASSFGTPQITANSVVPDLSRPDPAPWGGPGAMAVSTTEQSLLNIPAQTGGIASYPSAPPGLGSTSTFLPTNWQHDGLARIPEYQPLSTTGHGAEPTNARRASIEGSAVAGQAIQKRRRGRPPIQTHGLGINAPAYVPPALLRGASSSATHSQPTSPPSSAATSFFDIPGAYTQPFRTGSDTSVTTPLRPDDTHSSFSSSSTPTQTKPASAAAPSRRASTSTIKSTTTTATTTTNPIPSKGKNNKPKPTAQARNRAAASRYRAKTQAAFAQLEAEEREASARHATLVRCAAGLRDEVFALKNELLRHADCDCPLIRGYLAHAAERACAGLRVRRGSSLFRGEGEVGVGASVPGEGESRGGTEIRVGAQIADGTPALVGVADGFQAERRAEADVEPGARAGSSIRAEASAMSLS